MPSKFLIPWQVSIPAWTPLRTWQGHQRQRQKAAFVVRRWLPHVPGMFYFRLEWWRWTPVFAGNDWYRPEPGYYEGPRGCVECWMLRDGSRLCGSFASLRRPLGRIWRCKDVEDPFKQCSQRGVPLQVGMVSNLVTGKRYSTPASRWASLRASKYLKMPLTWLLPPKTRQDMCTTCKRGGRMEKLWVWCKRN